MRRSSKGRLITSAAAALGCVTVPHNFVTCFYSLQCLFYYCKYKISRGYTLETAEFLFESISIKNVSIGSWKEYLDIAMLFHTLTPFTLIFPRLWMRIPPLFSTSPISVVT